MWTPIPFEEIQEMINQLPFQLNKNEFVFWNLIQITPEKWQENTMGKEGGGFWVVALLGSQAIYYNDIEEGFNTSSYAQYGLLDKYYCNQSSLVETIKYYYQYICNAESF